MKRAILWKWVLVMVLFVALSGCVFTMSNKYKTMYGISDWYYTNHITLEAQYAASTPDQQAWLRKNVNPYMNVLKWVVVGMSAVDQKDDAKITKCINEINRLGLIPPNWGGERYLKIIAALKAKDFDTLISEGMALKTLIINNLVERKV